MRLLDVTSYVRSSLSLLHLIEPFECLAVSHDGTGGAIGVNAARSCSEKARLGGCLLSSGSLAPSGGSTLGCLSAHGAFPLAGTSTRRRLPKTSGPRQWKWNALTHAGRRRVVHRAKLPVGRGVGACNTVTVIFQRAATHPTVDQAFWVAIRNRTHAISFEFGERRLRPDQRTL